MRSMFALDISAANSVFVVLRNNSMSQPEDGSHVVRTSGSFYAPMDSVSKGVHVSIVWSQEAYAMPYKVINSSSGVAELFVSLVLRFLYEISIE
jgi:hypothetical protein